MAVVVDSLKRIGATEAKACSKTENTQRTGLVYIADIERSTSGRVPNHVPRGSLLGPSFRYLSPGSEGKK